MLQKMKDILLYNRNHFYNEFQKIITKELFNNLDTALKHKNNAKEIFSKIIENLTSAEIHYIKNLNVELDYDNSNDDYFHMDILSNTLNDQFTKNNLDQSYIRPLVIQHAKHFKYYYLTLLKSNKI
jgi:hypothetical protein